MGLCTANKVVYGFGIYYLFKYFKTITTPPHLWCDRAKPSHQHYLWNLDSTKQKQPHLTCCRYNIVISQQTHDTPRTLLAHVAFLLSCRRRIIAPSTSFAKAISHIHLRQSQSSLSLSLSLLAVVPHYLPINRQHHTKRIACWPPGKRKPNAGSSSSSTNMWCHKRYLHKEVSCRLYLYI